MFAYLATKMGIKCSTTADPRRLTELARVPDEEALDPLNPEYSCCTCACVECPDWGMRFCSCSDHQKQ